MLPSPRADSRAERNCRIAGIVSAKAAMHTRAVTAASGLQPALNRLDANEPEVPNAAPDTRAKASPTLLIDRCRTACPLLRPRNGQNALSSLHGSSAGVRSQHGLCP